MTARRQARLRVWFDGACAPVNPGGTASWGFWIERIPSYRVLIEESGLIGSGPMMTNNVAEYRAVREAFDWLLAHWQMEASLVVRGDSLMVIRQLEGTMRVKRGLYLPEHQRARLALSALRDRGHRVAFEWIPRAENYRADALSKHPLVPLGLA